MALTQEQLSTARQLIALAESRGLSPNRAREFAAAAYSESGLNPNIDNSSSGAAGLFQLLSSGYRTKAQQLGGLHNPRANALAILPNYLSYWKGHPKALPGEAGASVEASGEGAGFYSKGLPLMPNGGVAPMHPQISSMIDRHIAPPDTRRLAALQGLRALATGTYDPLRELDALRASIGAQTATGALTAPHGHIPGNLHPIGPDVPATPGAASLASIASQQLGQPYVWGGESRKEGGFDCSGLVDWAARQEGYTGPRMTTYTIAKMGMSVKGKPLQPGDLVLANHGEHVVIYAGGGRVIAAPHTGTVVQYQPLSKFDITDVRRI